MIKIINNNTINNLYNIEQTKNNIKIFNNKESILLYYLDDYVNNHQNVANSINIIEENIGSYGFCENREDIEFWLNLKKCIIIYSNDLNDYVEIFKNKENSLIKFVNENNILNIFN